MKENDFGEWDKIYDLRDAYAKENPEIKSFKRFKTYKDEESVVRCAKCGATEDISNCPECQEEKKFLNSKS